MNKIQQRQRRVKSVSKFVKGTEDRLRLVVHRTNSHIYAQIIDDISHKTVASATDAEVKKKLKPTELAKEVGTILGEKAAKAKVKNVVFDRRGFKYHGRVKALADGAREAGLNF
jgi:large subunit ribosomal protein L18